MRKILQTEGKKHPIAPWKAVHYLTLAEELVLSIMLTVMILLACYQIGLRWFTSGGLPWIDPLLRYLVLWSGFLGAALATGKDRHISLDVISYLLGKRMKLGLKLVAFSFSTIVAFFLLRATLLFIQGEYAYGGDGLFGIPSWVWNLIFPIAFAMICLHFGICVLAVLRELFAANASGQNE